MLNLCRTLPRTFPLFMHRTMNPHIQAKRVLYRNLSTVFSRSTESNSDLCHRLNFHNNPGRHTIKSPVVGSRAEELLAVKKAMKYESVLGELQSAIYKETFIYLIPVEKKEKADEIARELFLNYISKYAAHGCTERNIVYWYPGGKLNRMFAYEVENEWNTWSVHAVVESNGNYKNHAYLPPHVVAYHELMHVEEMPLKAGSITEKGNELLTTIKTIMLIDTVYKKIYGIKESDEVDYHRYIHIDGNKISLGKFANFYRELEIKLGKLYLALISPTSIEFLKGKRDFVKL